MTLATRRGGLAKFDVRFGSKADLTRMSVSDAKRTFVNLSMSAGCHLRTCGAKRNLHVEEE